MRARSAVRAVPRRAPARAGFTLFELLVAFSILSVIVSVAGGLLVRHKRLLASARHQRIAVEELANQMDRLTALDRGAREAFLAAPEPSSFAAARLPGATLAAAVDPPAGALGRTLRGGSWDFAATTARLANRYRCQSDNRYDYLGFRLARAIGPGRD